MRADFRMFRGGSMQSWEALFQEATDFASRLGRERLITISQSQCMTQGIVVVWYWSDAGPTAVGGSHEEHD